MTGIAAFLEAQLASEGGVDWREIAALLGATFDVVLLLDASGAVRAATAGQSEELLAESQRWLGRPWAETVTAESRARVMRMYREASESGISRNWDVTHESAVGAEIPVRYTAMRLPGTPGRILACGREWRAVSALEERLVDAQQALERDYRRMRDIESRYRLLVNVTTDAVLLVDATSGKVVEANPAAAKLFRLPIQKLVGRAIPFGLAGDSASRLSAQFSVARTHGVANEVQVDIHPTEGLTKVSIWLVRQEGVALFLVRFLPEGAREVPGGVSGEVGVARQVAALPDGFVVTDADGRVLIANRAFLELIEVPNEDQVRGRLLSQWIGRPGADLTRLRAALREHGMVRLYGTSLRGELGSTSDIEISCSANSGTSDGSIGFVIRDVGARVGSAPHGASDLMRALAQLTSLVGRVSLRNLVRDTTDHVERHFIEAALETTGGNRTAAAEVLGISRQSLYVKLRRYALGRAGAVEHEEGLPVAQDAEKPRRH